MTTEYTAWTAADAAAEIVVPDVGDDKYSRGVLGVITGSTRYPGAAVLGVEAALRTGVGMVRYLGPSVPTAMVLARRPEAVSANGRVQAWLIGSGIPEATPGQPGEPNESANWMSEAVAQDVPVVLDAGALSLLSAARGPVIITPHAGELARVLGTSVENIRGDPGAAAAKAADSLGVTVLLKGNTTYVASPDGTRLSARCAPTWLATAGAGDALGGILGALVATHAGALGTDAALAARLAATASVIHGLAAERASGGGPLVVLDVACAVSRVIAGLLGA